MRDVLNGFAPECGWFSGAKIASSIGPPAGLPLGIRWLEAGGHCGVVRSCLLLVALFAVVGLTGCSGEGSPGGLYFSPDGSIVAHTYVNRINLPLPPEMPTIYSTVYLQWCRSDQLKECRSVKIDSYGKSYGSFVQGKFLLMFSPDSKQLAVKSPRYLEVVDHDTPAADRPG